MNRLKLFIKSVGFIGFIFLFFGGMFPLIFIEKEMMNDFSLKLKETENTIGNVQSMYPTNTSVNGNSVYGYQYAYTVNGKDYQGVSYDTFLDNAENTQVEVIYTKSYPEISKIEDMDTTPGGMMLLVTILFPIAGVVMIISGIKRYKKIIYLINNGRETYGIYIESYKIGTRSRINNKTYYKYVVVIEFTDQLGRTVRFNDKTYLPEKYQNRNDIKIIHDKDYPEDAVIIEDYL